jgi:hypothetical protein
MKVRKMANLIHDHRTAVTTRVWPAVDAGSEHEMIKDKLAAAFK